MSGFTTPAKLQRLARNLAAIPAKLAPAVAQRLQERVRDTYANEEDAYGNPWPELAESTVRRKGGNSVILTRTGASQADCGARALGGAGVAVYAGGAASHHQQASGTRPARPVLPDHGLPPTWRQDIADVAGQEFAKALGRASR
jgi:hypothetical protein